MPKAFVLTVAVCVWGFVAAAALADKGGPAEQNEKARLLKQIAELKAMVAKLHGAVAQQQVEAEDRARTVDAWKRAMAEKGFHKGPHPEHRHAMERLENIRAAVKHLNAAGLKEIAVAVAKQGDQIQAALQKHHPPGHFKGEFKAPKGGQPGFFKGGKPGQFKGDQPQFFKGNQPPFHGDKSHKPADAALGHHLKEMGAAIGRLSKQVEQLQKAVGVLQKRR